MRIRGITNHTPATRRDRGSREHSIRHWAQLLAEKGRAVVQSARDNGIPLGHRNSIKEKARI